VNAALAWVTFFIDSIENYSPNIVIEDINEDGSINMADVVLVAKVFGLSNGKSGFDNKCDLNNDGVINMSDIVKLALSFGDVIET